MTDDTKTLKEELGLLDLHEAAVYLGRSERSLLDKKYKHTGPKGTKYGNELLYKKEDLLAWFNATAEFFDG